jgi:3-deoxy-manno-octulosonate cytidylyltransferase (CMP-KDO synthetase)
VRVVVCIPARYESTRFPGKMLAKRTGKFLIQHTYEQACRAGIPDEVIIAADDPRIMAAAEAFGARCVLTSQSHQTGTDRIAEATAEVQADIVVNLQGDEPQIDPGHIDQLAQLLIDTEGCDMATLGAPIENPDDIGNPNIVKLVTDQSGRALYFSRSVLPYHRDTGGVGPVDLYLRHIGMYAYRKAFLQTITELPQGVLERTEKLEQLRVLEHGYDILVGRVSHVAEGIDTPEQYDAFVEQYQATGGSP